MISTAPRSAVVGALLALASAGCQEGQVGGVVVPDGSGEGVEAGGGSEAGPDSKAAVDAATTDHGPPCKLTCAGCCLDDFCLPGSSDNACGAGGAACRDCTLNGQTCKDGSCVGICKPYCTGRCKGEDDGCGDPCPTNTCTGCCDVGDVCQPGTASSACGTSGETCASCPVSTPTCVSGTCKCVPDCAAKCQGVDDGCGGTCPINTCFGCCDASNVCQPGTADNACGLAGAACVDCAASGEKCAGWKCKCFPSCNGKCQGADDGCGSPCLINHCKGCCDASKACQAGTVDTACGENGAACTDCTLSSQTCTSQSCS